MTSTPAPQVTGWSPLPDPLPSNGDAVRAQAAAIAEALVAEDKDARSVAPARAKAAAEANQKLVDTLTTVTTGGIDRARSGAQFVQTAATAIAGLYTGILGVLFVNDAAAPLRAFIPMLFLGLAVVLATFYLAFVTPGKRMNPPAYEFNADRDMWIRLNFVNKWVRRIVFPRAWALRTAVISLAFGLIFLPIGVIRLPVDFEVTGLPVKPAATAAPVVWPAPTLLPDPSLSLALYEAQLAEFRENLPPPPAGPDTSYRDNVMAAILALLALLVVGLVARDPWGWWKLEEGTDQIIGPTQGGGRNRAEPPPSNAGRDPITRDQS